MNRSAKPYYQAYLVRFWKERESAEQQSEAWRFSVEDPHSGERKGFGSLELFINFLEGQMEKGNESL